MAHRPPRLLRRISTAIHAPAWHPPCRLLTAPQAYRLVKNSIINVDQADQELGDEDVFDDVAEVEHMVEEQDMAAAAAAGDGDGDAEMASAEAGAGPGAAAAAGSDAENRDANADPASTADKQAAGGADAGAAEGAAAAAAQPLFPAKKAATKVPQQKFNNVKVGGHAAWQAAWLAGAPAGWLPAGAVCSPSLLLPLFSPPFAVLPPSLPSCSPPTPACPLPRLPYLPSRAEPAGDAAAAAGG